MLSLLGLTEFFPVLVIGSECDRAKPFPDPYLKALELIGASPDHTFIFEVHISFVLLFTIVIFSFIINYIHVLFFCFVLRTNYIHVKIVLTWCSSLSRTPRQGFEPV